MTRVPNPREALGQTKPRRSIDPDSNRQEVSAADRTKSSSLNSFYPLGKCGSRSTLWSSDYFRFKFITLFPLNLTSSSWVQSHPMSWDQQGSQRHKVVQKNRFQQASEKQTLQPYRDSLGDHRVASLLLSILGHQLVSN